MMNFRKQVLFMFARAISNVVLPVLAAAVGSAPVLLVPFLATLASGQNIQRNPIVTHANGVTTTVPFRDMAEVQWHNLSRVRPEHRNPNPHITRVTDGLFQNEVLPEVGTTSLLNFDGITDAQGGGFVPPDTNASVGDSQMVETVNIAFAVWDKTTGTQIMAPKNIQTLYTPLGGECAAGNLVDPVVNYDKAAGRWVISMSASNNNFSVNDICVAVSTSSDATGTYHLYAFSYGGTLPDYPKLGVWPDAYYLTTLSYPGGGRFTGSESCALDRTQMLAGNNTTSICFQRNRHDFALLPSDLDGSMAPPAGSPNYQMDEDPTTTTLNLYQFHVDFVTPTNSTFTGPATLMVAAYTDACGRDGTCIPQPSPGELLDSKSGRLMFRLAYRNFGDHEALVANHSITTSGSGHAASAVRWYEIRSPKSSPVVFLSGTVGGGTSRVARWMGSIAMDKNGDIALGFSLSSKTLDPSIQYVGRVPTDALGKMESPKTIIKGTGVQTKSQGSWGDYSSMAIDPGDDCTFWYAQEYYKTTGSLKFDTRLASFKFTGCY